MGLAFSVLGLYKSYFNNDWVGVAKNGRGLKDRGTLKPGISHK